MEPDERAKAGLFLAFQYPTSIPGVTVANFLRHAVTNVRNPDRKEGEDLIPMREFRKELREQMDELGMDHEFARRYLNEGFSGGEKKRAEVLQLAMLRPAVRHPRRDRQRPRHRRRPGRLRGGQPGRRQERRPASWSSPTTSAS